MTGFGVGFSLIINYQLPYEFADIFMMTPFLLHNSSTVGELLGLKYVDSGHRMRESILACYCSDFHVQQRRFHR